MNKEVISKVSHTIGNVATVAASYAAIAGVINEKDVETSRKCSNFGIGSYAVACAAYLIERFSWK